MHNCPLETTQIACVMALNVRNCTIYGAAPQTSPRGFTAPPPWTPAARELILRMSAFVTKLNLYQKTATAKSTWMKAC